MERKRKQQRTRRPKASAIDVLGNRDTVQRVRPKWQKHYHRLLELQNELIKRKEDLANAATEERPSFSMHMADAGTDTYDRDFALSMMSLEQDGLYEIQEALSRILHGTYAFCELTGKPIEPERLEAIPWTRFSADAEKRLEKDGAVRRPRLAPREPVNRTSGETDSELSEPD